MALLGLGEAGSAIARGLCSPGGWRESADLGCQAGESDGTPRHYPGSRAPEAHVEQVTLRRQDKPKTQEQDGELGRGEQPSAE